MPLVFYCNGYELLKMVENNKNLIEEKWNEFFSI